MAVAHDVSSESHTGTTGHTGSSSFTWNHAGGGSARGALVFVVGVVTNATPPVTSVTYGGTTMTAIPYTAKDTDTEPGQVTAYYLDNCGTGTKAVVVNRSDSTPWAHILYATCSTVTASVRATEVYLPGVKTYGGSASNTAASTSGTGTQTTTVVSIDDGSPGTNSVRFACRYTGAASPGTAATGSTVPVSIDFTAYGIALAYQNTPSQGAADVGFSSAGDDTAMIALAVRELAVLDIGVTAATGTGAASDAGRTVSAAAAASSGTGLASNATFSAPVTKSIDVVVATGTGAAADADANPGLAATAAAGTGSASNAAFTRSTSPAVTAATGTGVASSASASLKPAVGAASGTGAASPAGVSLSPAAAAATGTGATTDATFQGTEATNVSITAATGTGAASIPAATISAAAAGAVATGAAANAAAAVSKSIAVTAAAATGAAANAAPSLGLAATAAAATGSASNAAASVKPVAAAATGHARFAHGVTTAWAEGDYVTGDRVIPSTGDVGFYYTAVTDNDELHTSGPTEPVWPTTVGGTVGDTPDITWTCAIAVQSAHPNVQPGLAVATGTGATTNATFSAAVLKDVAVTGALATGAASAASASIVPGATPATGTGAATNVTFSAAVPTLVDVTAATGAGTATNPAVELHEYAYAAAIAATGAGAAFSPALHLALAAQMAAGTGAAFDPDWLTAHLVGLAAVMRISDVVPGIHVTSGPKAPHIVDARNVR